MKKLPVISLFSGALGLDLGLEQAGFQIRVAVECNRFAAETIRLNRPDIPVIERKLENVSTKEILDNARLNAEEVAVVVGGPSCQAFSTAGHRKSLADPRGTMFKEFLRVVADVRPRFFVMENVRGILSAAIRHRHLKDRGPGFPPLHPDEELGSAFTHILMELKAVGYYVVFDVLDARDYGVPQGRERVVFIGSRDGEPIATPPKTHAEVPQNGTLPWVTLREGLAGLEDPVPAHHRLCPSKAKYLKLIPEGGNWRDLPANLREEALGGAFKSWGGRSGFFRRLAWDRPSPALTTKPDSKATMLCHPTELRTLSVREYARIQQFPDGWIFAGGLPQQFIQIGNAVPVGLGKAIAVMLRSAMRRRTRKSVGTITCSNANLFHRLTKRPSTILNPPRMRKVKDPDQAKLWLDQCKNERKLALDQIDWDLPEAAQGPKPKRSSPSE